VVHSVFSGVKTNKKTISESQERRGERKEVTNLVTRWELSLGRKTKKLSKKREKGSTQFDVIKPIYLK